MVVKCLKLHTIPMTKLPPLKKFIFDFTVTSNAIDFKSVNAIEPYSKVLSKTGSQEFLTTIVLRLVSFDRLGSRKRITYGSGTSDGSFIGMLL